MDSRPKIGPSGVTRIPFSVKFAAPAAASFLVKCTICFFMAATTFSRSCGSGMLRWAKAGKATLIATMLLVGLFSLSCLRLEKGPFYNQVLQFAIYLLGYPHAGFVTSDRCLN